jgi:spermidine synthase
VRTLHVGGEAIQSSMRIAEPYALALDYTRCMMAFLLFHPEPREALMIGLGGGSLAKFFHRRLRSTRVRVVELDARARGSARAFRAAARQRAAESRGTAAELIIVP